jgi:hypothetical protein
MNLAILHTRGCIPSTRARSYAYALGHEDWTYPGCRNHMWRASMIHICPPCKQPGRAYIYTMCGHGKTVSPENPLTNGLTTTTFFAESSLVGPIAKVSHFFSTLQTKKVNAEKSNESEQVTTATQRTAACKMCIGRPFV